MPTRGKVQRNPLSPARGGEGQGEGDWLIADSCLTAESYFFFFISVMCCIIAALNFA